MRAIAIGLIAAMGCAIAGSCLLDRKSTDFKCSTTTECDSGRTCVDGHCVTGTTPPPDGPDLPACQLSGCEIAGGSCVDDTCTFRCEQDGSCPTPVTCPPGVACDVTCAGDNSCGGGVQCLATSCRIECSGDGACGGMISCGSGACDVACEGDGSCGGTVQCSTSCACDVSCDGLGACGGTQNCPAPLAQCEDSPGCTSAPNPCDTCP